MNALTNPLDSAHSVQAGSQGDTRGAREERDMGDVLPGRWQGSEDQPPTIGIYRDPNTGLHTVEGLAGANAAAYEQAFGPMPTLDESGFPVLPAQFAPTRPTRRVDREQAPAARTEPRRTRKVRREPGTSEDRERGVAGRALAGAGAWYRSEAERRRDLRRDLRPVLRQARRDYRRDLASDPRRVQPSTRRSRSELRKVRRRYPNSMWWLTSKVAVAATAAGVYLGPRLVERVPVRVWSESFGGLILAGAGVLAVRVLWPLLRGRGRKGLRPTPEERRLLTRLSPAQWVRHAKDRGLSGTITGKATLTPAGIVVAVRLGGQWTPGKLAEAQPHVRALLGARKGLRVMIGEGERGDWAEMVLRTRSAADGQHLNFDYDDQSTWNLGMDTVTGLILPAPIGKRVLIAGKTGAGKSIASRMILFLASEGPTDALAIIDLKQVEGRLWDHRARIASNVAQIVALCTEVMAELTWRLGVMPKGQTDWKPTPEHPRITLVVDEGAEAIKQVKDVIGLLESVAAMGRAPEVILVWMTQKPTMSGEGHGIPSLVAAQMDVRMCLRVSTPGEARTVLGEDATSAGFDSSTLPVPGFSYIRGELAGLTDSPHPIRIRYMDNNQVINLPDRPIWSRTQVADTAPNVVQLHPEPTPAASEAEALVLAAIEKAGGPVRQTDIVTETGVPKGSVSRIVKRLENEGRIVRQPDGSIAAA